MALSELFKALGDDNRIRILNILRYDELCVCDIEEILGVTQSNASRHLNKLENAGLVTFRKKSQWVYYRLNEKFINGNKQLIDYLVDKFKTSKQLVKDIKTMQEYKDKGLGCEKLTQKIT
ncbi:MAG: ArsR family transcriptional regulator [Clostridiaceae bacterium BRH_c20a]|nr:MAG: ArsR family transcriptional regulator [Clostridiaceae bacterium BRH_c20a]